MSQTIREKIIAALKTRLKNYSWQQWDPDVFVGQSVFDPDVDPLPVLTILAGVEEAAQTRYGTDQITMPIDISGLISLSPDTSKEATDRPDGRDVSEYCEPIFGEMRKACFYGGVIQIGDDYFTLSYRGGGIMDYPSELGPVIISIGVRLAITYETNIGDPYS